MTVASKRGVQVDDMRHDSRAEHSRGEEYCLSTIKAWYEPGGRLLGIRRMIEQSDDETDRDDHHQSDDDALEVFLFRAIIDDEQEHRHDAGDDSPQEEWHSKQQVECQCTSDHLGDITGDSYQLSLHPVGESALTAELFGNHLWHTLASHEADFCTEILHEHRHDICHDQHPQ